MPPGVRWEETGTTYMYIKTERLILRPFHRKEGGHTGMPLAKPMVNCFEGRL